MVFFSIFPIDTLQKVNSDWNSNRIQIGKSSWLYLIFLIMSGLISHIQLLFLIFSLLGETRDNFFRFWLELITSFKTLGSAKQFVQSKYSKLELLIVPEQLIYYQCATKIICFYRGNICTNWKDSNLYLSLTHCAFIINGKILLHIANLSSQKI